MTSNSDQFEPGERAYDAYSSALFDAPPWLSLTSDKRLAWRKVERTLAFETRANRPARPVNPTDAINRIAEALCVPVTIFYQDWSPPRDLRPGEVVQCEPGETLEDACRRLGLRMPMPGFSVAQPYIERRTRSGHKVVYGSTPADLATTAKALGAQPFTWTIDPAWVTKTDPFGRILEVQFPEGNRPDIFRATFVSAPVSERAEAKTMDQHLDAVRAMPPEAKATAQRIVSEYLALIRATGIILGDDMAGPVAVLRHIKVDCVRDPRAMDALLEQIAHELEKGKGDA